MPDAPPGMAGGSGSGGLRRRDDGLPAAAAAAGMQACAKCGGEAKRPRDCEHTGWAAYCTECYVELHYYLTEPGAEAR